MTANIKIFATKQLNKTLSFITIEISRPRKVHNQCLYNRSMFAYL